MPADEQSRGKVCEHHDAEHHIERLRDGAGVPILYVSHSVAEVARLATTVVILTEGRVAAVGEGVSRWKVGDAVCALVAGGGYDDSVAARLTAAEGAAGRLLAAWAWS